jgi:outer membrane protein TolC
MNKKIVAIVLGLFLTVFVGENLAGEEAAEGLTLKRAIELADKHSREIMLARLRVQTAERFIQQQRAPFYPEAVLGSGLAYSNGFPLSIEGSAPSIIDAGITASIFNPRQRNLVREAQQLARASEAEVDKVRGDVFARTSAAYLELNRLRRAHKLLGQERESAQKILEIITERRLAGLEPPVELTRARLELARIEYRIAEVEGQAEASEAELRDLTGIRRGTRIELVDESLPVAGNPDASGLMEEELIRVALEQNPGLRQAEFQTKAKEFRLKSEQGGYFPTVDLVGRYSVLARFNNYDEFFRRFQRHNVTAGIAMRFPVLSFRTSRRVAGAKSELSEAELELEAEQARLELEVRRLARKVKESAAAREVSRLELQLATEQIQISQARFDEGRIGLSELEKVRVEENNRWIAFLESDVGYQRAQLELAKITGQILTLFK